MYFSLFWRTIFENGDKYGKNNKPEREELTIQTAEANS